jgi:CrcB protein
VTLLFVLLGGAVGAVTRFLVGHLVHTRVDESMPWGTLTVNVTGSLLLGLVAGASTGLPGWVGSLVGTGFCGALTTYSTFAYETARLSRWRALVNVTLTLVIGIGAAALGWFVTSTFGNR